MLAEALSWYLESLTAFWSGMAHGGLLRLIILGGILWWIFGRKGRCWSCCPRCGCWCGRCRCREAGGHEARTRGGAPRAGAGEPGGGGTSEAGGPGTGEAGAAPS